MSIRTIVGAATMALVLTGCGSDDSATPVEKLPGLGVTLERLDQAVSQKRYQRARRYLDDLVETVELAQQNDLIDDAEAERLLAAASALGAVMPTETPPTAGSPSVGPAPTSPGGAGAGDDKKPGKKNPGSKGSGKK